MKCCKYVRRNLDVFISLLVIILTLVGAVIYARTCDVFLCGLTGFFLLLIVIMLACLVEFIINLVLLIKNKELSITRWIVFMFSFIGVVLSVWYSVAWGLGF